MRKTNSLKWFILKLAMINYRNVNHVLCVLYAWKIIGKETFDRLKLSASNMLNKPVKWVYSDYKTDEETMIFCNRFCQMFKETVEGEKCETLW